MKITPVVVPVCVERGILSINHMNKVAEGNYASIYKHNDRNGAHAVKVFSGDYAVQSGIREFHAMMLIRGHPNIVEINKLTIHDCGRCGLALSIQMNHVNAVLTDMIYTLSRGVIPPLSDVDKYPESSPYRLVRGQALVVGISMDIMAGINWMHECGILHCDIKPDNILIDKTTSRAILCDFSISAPITEKYHSPLVVSEQWRAPELLYPYSEQLCRFDGGIDIYAAGWTILSMLNGRICPAYADGSDSYESLCDFYEIKYPGKCISALAHLNTLSLQTVTEKIVDAYHVTKISKWATAFASMIAGWCMPNPQHRQNVQAALSELQKMYNILTNQFEESSQPVIIYHPVQREQCSVSEIFYKKVLQYASESDIRNPPEMLQFAARILQSLCATHAIDPNSTDHAIKYTEMIKVALCIATTVHTGSEESFDDANVQINEEYFISACVHHNWIM